LDALTIGLLSLAAIMALIAIRLPIGVALGGVTMFGFAYLTNWNVALGVIR
jgi:C4-dicarboxylate transporter DctM subunit